MKTTTALMIVFAIMLTVYVVVGLVRKEKPSSDDSMDVVVVKPHPLTPPKPGSKLAFIQASTNNTLEMRPGSRYNLDVLSDVKVPPAYTIKLLYKHGCAKHQLVMLFEYVAKQMMTDGTAATANIQFTRELVDPLSPINLYGGFPKVVKIRRSGQMLEYTGYTDYGPFTDWVLNEGILF